MTLFDLTPDKSQLVKIVEVICGKHGVQINEVLSRRQGKQLIAARTECYAALWDTGLTHPEIGDIMNRHPSAIAHCLSRKAELGRL
jgi:hypothetical protein